MSCAASDRLIQTLKTQIPGVTDDMLNLQLYNVVDEFLRRTSAWKVENEVTLIEGHQTYDLGLPVGAEFVRMMAVMHNGIPVAPAASQVTPNALGRLAPELTFPDSDASFHPVATDANPSTGMFTYAVFAPDYIQITSSPDAEAVKFPMIAIMAAALGKRCLECECDEWPIPEWMWDMFFQAWLDSALSRFYAMPAKPWSSPTLAAVHGKRGFNKTSYHKQEAARGHSYATANWRYPRRGEVDLNQPYDTARVRMVTGALNWPLLNLVLTAWGGPPTFVPEHVTIANISAPDLGHSLSIVGKGVDIRGTCQTDNVLIPTVPVGQDVTFFTMSELLPNYRASKLLFYIDDAKFLPFTPNGLDIIVTPDWLENRGWFRA